MQLNNNDNQKKTLVKNINHEIMKIMSSKMTLKKYHFDDDDDEVDALSIFEDAMTHCVNFVNAIDSLIDNNDVTKNDSICADIRDAVDIICNDMKNGITYNNEHADTTDDDDDINDYMSYVYCKIFDIYNDVFSTIYDILKEYVVNNNENDGNVSIALTILQTSMTMFK